MVQDRFFWGIWIYLGCKMTPSHGWFLWDGLWRFATCFIELIPMDHTSGKKIALEGMTESLDFRIKGTAGSIHLSPYSQL